MAKFTRSEVLNRIRLYALHAPLKEAVNIWAEHLSPPITENEMAEITAWVKKEKTEAAAGPQSREDQMWKHLKLQDRSAKPVSQHTMAMRQVKDKGLYDLSGNPIGVDHNGLVTLYHRTTQEAAKRINSTGKFLSKENTDETFFSTRSTGQAEGYGDTVVVVKVPVRDIAIHDAFKNEIHVAVKNSKLSLRNIMLYPTRKK